MTRTMRAYRMTAWQQAPEAVEVRVPEPGPGQVLVKVAGCGLCHSDLAMRQLPGDLGALLGWSMPYTLGHETGGHVAAIGADVTGFAEGDAVVLVSGTSCGGCWYCVRGLDNS
ncbi:MAG TPA: alcohol dehydrogenase catalytic domain-containing protein, partial [Kribbellaceae bacterium]